MLPGAPEPLARRVRLPMWPGQPPGEVEADMGLMSTLAIGAASYWLYRSGRLTPYFQQVKDSPFVKQIKDKAGMGTGSAVATPPQETAGGATAHTPETSLPRA